jgi:ankyrin repeat protein
MAVVEGHLDVLQLLITSCPDAASPELYGSPMHGAATTGNVQAMQILLQHGADINATPGTPWSDPYPSERPLHAAIAKRQAPATIQWMLEQGADAGPALPAAAEAGNLPVLSLLLDWGADISTWGGRAFSTALFECQSQAACLLLRAGPPDYFMSAAHPHPGIKVNDINHCVNRFLQLANGDHHASALLQAAVQHGHTHFAQLLEQRGATLPTGRPDAQDVQQDGSYGGPGWLQLCAHNCQQQASQAERL